MSKIKRLFDVCCAALGLIVLSPVILIVAILISFKIGRPIVFKQERPGLDGKPFFIYKFRTMTDKRDGKGELLPDQQRMTKFGQLVRSFSLDELPQLWNVLKGELSFVGPRPLLVEYMELYSPEQARRHEVKPGITGWAQINGRNAVTWEEKFELDVWYVDHQSFQLDMQILWKTFLKVFKREGISAENHVTVAKFEGTKDGVNETNCVNR